MFEDVRIKFLNYIDIAKNWAFNQIEKEKMEVHLSKASILHCLSYVVLNTFPSFYAKTKFLIKIFSHKRIHSPSHFYVTLFDWAHNLRK